MFEWDERKNVANRLKHGLAFEDVLHLFGIMQTDGLVLEDKRRDYGEARFILLCPSGGRLYHVTFTPRQNRIRVISARRASTKESREYAKRKHN